MPRVDLSNNSFQRNSQCQRVSTEVVLGTARESATWGLASSLFCLSILPVWSAKAIARIFSRFSPSNAQNFQLGAHWLEMITWARTKQGRAGKTCLSLPFVLEVLVYIFDSFAFQRPWFGISLFFFFFLSLFYSLLGTFTTVLANLGSL